MSASSNTTVCHKAWHKKGNTQCVCVRVYVRACARADHKSEAGAQARAGRMVGPGA